MAENPEHALRRLAGSTFRAGFHLNAADRAYARARGRGLIAAHAHDLLAGRIGAAHPRNDGRQTPYRGHPVFTAQHATATCCRGCVQKWHGIPEGQELTAVELDRLVALVMAWIDRDLSLPEPSGAPHPPRSTGSSATAGRQARGRSGGPTRG